MTGKVSYQEIRVRWRGRMVTVEAKITDDGHLLIASVLDSSKRDPQTFHSGHLDGEGKYATALEALSPEERQELICLVLEHVR